MLRSRPDLHSSALRAGATENSSSSGMRVFDFAPLRFAKAYGSGEVVFLQLTHGSQRPCARGARGAFTVGHAGVAPDGARSVAPQDGEDASVLICPLRNGWVGLVKRPALKR
jgi:hypothetical protein